MRLELINSLQIIIIALLAYAPTVTFAGWFEAWVAKKCGDDLPEQSGFLTLDPMAHFNVIGFTFLLVGKLLGSYVPFFQGIPGWGRYVPLNPVSGSSWRVTLQYHARGLAHLFLAIVAITVIVKSMKMGYMSYSWDIPVQTSSAVSSFIHIMSFLYSQNMMLCVIYLAVGSFRSIVYHYFPDFQFFAAQHTIWGMLLLFCAIILCAEIYRFVLMNIMVVLMYALS